MPEYRWRVSPSGPFIRDGVSNGPLPVGDGSTGRIWRAQGATPGAAPVTIASLTAGVIPDLNVAWSIPVGFHYDVKAKLHISSTVQPTVGFFYVDIEAEQNSVWASIINFTAVPLAFACEQYDVPATGGPETYCYTVENIDLDLTGATFPITGVRVLLTEDPALGMTFLQQQSNLRIEQYVIT